MAVRKVAVTINEELMGEVDGRVAVGEYPNTPSSGADLGQHARRIVDH